MKRPKKVVLDTNIWISYIISGKLNELTVQILTYQLKVYTCNELAEELSDVLSRSKTRKLLKFPTNTYLRFIHKVTTNKTINLEFSNAPDPKDNFLFDLAIQSGATLVVTGDKQLLGVDVTNLRIITLSEFKKQFPI